MSLIEVKVPTLGETMRSGLIAKWHVKNGATVVKDQPLFELESDKITIEGVAVASGIITLKAATGAEVGVGEIVAIIDTTAKTSEPGSVGADSTTDMSDLQTLSKALGQIVAKSPKGPAALDAKGATLSILADFTPESMVNLMRRAYEAKIIAPMIAAAGRRATGIEFGQWSNALKASYLPDDIAIALIRSLAEALKIQLPGDTNTKLPPLPPAEKKDVPFGHATTKTPPQPVVPPPLPVPPPTKPLTTFKQEEAWCCSEIRLHKGMITALRFAPGQEFVLLSTGVDDVGIIHDLLNPLHAVMPSGQFEGFGGGIITVAISPGDGRYFLIGGDSTGQGMLNFSACSARLMDMSNGQIVYKYKGRSCVQSAAFSADGQYLALGFGLGQHADQRGQFGLVIIRLRDFRELHCVHPKGSYVGGYRELIAHPTQPDHFISCGIETAIWSFSTGQQVAEFTQQTGEHLKHCAALTADGQILALASEYIELYDVKSRNRISTIKPLDTIRALAFGPEGKHLYAGGDSQKIQVYEFSNRTEVAQYHCTSKVMRLAAAIRRRILSGHEDGVIADWPLLSK